MDKHIRRRIRNTWRDRLLLGMGSVAVLGFAVFQLQTTLKHRSPDQPSWALELGQSTEKLTDETLSSSERAMSVNQILDISKSRDLQTITWLLQDLEQSGNAFKNRELILTIARAQIRALALDRALDLDLARDLARDLALDLALARDLALDLDLALDRDLARALARALDLALDRDLARDLDLDRDLARALDRDLDLALDLARDLALDLALDLAWDRDLALDLDLAQQQAIDSELAAQLTEDIFLALVIAADVKRTHGLTLQTGDTLKKLVDNEPIRTRALMQAGILLSLSTLVLIGLLVMLTRLQGSPNLPRTATLIAFLPEECVAELGYLQRRLKKANISTWQIRRRLIHEFVFLLWVHYVQMQIDHLFLGSGQDHTIDD